LEDDMPTYVVLYRFTDEGRKNIKATVQKSEAINRENESRGFRVVGHYWTQGRFDLIAIVDAPSEEAMMSGLFNIAEAGNVASESMRAFSDAEMQGLLGSNT
jgi:uncharacterized protein with GYD domain